MAATMAQRWRAGRERQKSVAKPLNNETLEALALHYAGRYATSRAKLIAYLTRKLRERGWATADEPPVSTIADRMVALRYVDDTAYAAMTSGAMQRRGLGARRIAHKLAIDGIEEDVRSQASPDEAERWAAAERLARRKRIGPFAEAAPDRPLREKQIATFLRAGHDMNMARKWVDASPGEIPVDPEVETN
jgi:regulatory protein